MAIHRLTVDDGTDPEDGSELNAVRREALAMLERQQDIDDLTDVEVLSRSTDDLWYLDLCIDNLHRLPNEVDEVLLCREYTALRARSLVKAAQAKLIQTFGKQR